MAEMSERPVILQASHVKKAIADPRFYALMPEFLPLKRKVEALHIDLKKGCSSCSRRRVMDTTTGDFVSILNSLSQDGLLRLKKYVGAGRLLIRARDPKSNAFVMKEV